MGGSNGSGKRKQPPPGGAAGPNAKKRQGGNGGRWQTPHHRAKLETLRGRSIEIGDAGIWATCMRGKERQAADELLGICYEVCAALLFIPPASYFAIISPPLYPLSPSMGELTG